MAALVQSYPQQSSTITMLQTRPSSASGILQNASQTQSHHQYSANSQQMQRNSVHGMSNGIGTTSYRGLAPIAPYAFTSPPNLATPGQRQGPHLRADQRTISAPSGMVHLSESTQARSRYPAPHSVSTTSSSSSYDLSSLSHRSGPKDDSVITGTARVVPGAARPHSVVMGSNNGNLAPQTVPSPVKPSPDRYRRPNTRRRESSASQQPTTPTGSSMPNVMQFYGNNSQQASLPQVLPQSFNLQMLPFSNPTTGITSDKKSTDDLVLNRSTSQEAMKRYRRRSIHTIDAGDYGGMPGGLVQQGSRQVSSANGRIDQQQQHPLRSSPVGVIRPASSHGRTVSSESVTSIRSAARGFDSRPGSATKREASASMAPLNPAPSSQSTSANNLLADHSSTKHDSPRLVNIPPRASSTDAAKRIANPSPLSKPMTMSPESSVSKDSFTSAVQSVLQQAPAKPTYAQAASGPASPAAQQLAALNDKEGKKSKTSRLRRAFSFGSAAELRKASAENSAANNAVERSQQRKDKYQEEQDAEQARIAQRQEAGGIGSGIYSGQGNIFTGSTDNLSISSTASSASIMIRKMGKGMKKSTRSLVGLFRPKSVIGVPAADGPLPQASQAQVSMVTVEAEREKVNVNADPHDQVGGGTGFPRLERNSIDAAHATTTISERLGSASTENSTARRSIVGGEKERAEVLAAVKKGILKRTGTDSGNSSPVIRPLDSKSANFGLPQIPNVNDSPNSSAPSTPNDEQQAQRNNGSVTLGGEDYFMSALRFRGDSKSVPGTPQGTSTKRNATFSPRIQFHDTWPSGEYDRRGEIATCNRLTPMLAQQIKEEINNFKMEMVVHENSKIYTHFF
ncbi:related to BNI4 Bud neck involved [Rhynchosporium graminicola]|uniref:Related to BNI4 Bud neck involved n=1 Tax=Rhynchosporium graminicola TaxID=2792576 RepID=A0A1E1KCF8_9HELO|nr:related to BNI4 Bud neck involved [Rhynchosporium commune]